MLGFVATSQRRRSSSTPPALAALDSEGARLRSWDVDLNPFKQKPGEMLIGATSSTPFGDETVSDVALRAATDGRSNWWELAKVRLARRSALRRRPSYRLVDVDEFPELFDAPAAMAAEAARLRDMHPCDVAGIVRALPLRSATSSPRRWTTNGSPTCSKNCPRPSSSGSSKDSTSSGSISVLEEMEYDDLADLLGEMPGEQRTRSSRRWTRRTPTSCAAC